MPDGSNEIGRGLYEKFFRGYTREPWRLAGQVHPRTRITYEYPAADGDP